jgi:hypothetical protein
MQLRLNNRPAYHPVEGMLISDINVEWKGLEQVSEVLLTLAVVARDGDPVQFALA